MSATNLSGIQSGAETGDGLTLQLGAISSQSIGIKGMNVLSEDNATDVIDRIADAIGYVSAQRSRIGAQQNRLEHTVKNEQNIVENTTAAESQIRDTDMAPGDGALFRLKYIRAGSYLHVGAGQSK